MHAPRAALLRRGPLPFALRRFFLPAVVLLLSAAAAGAQSDAAGATRSSTVPRVPGISAFLRGFNAGVTVAGIHDAQSGWASLLQPAIGYTFGRHLSADVTLPIYLYRLQTLPQSPQPGPGGGQSPSQVVTRIGRPGDLVMSAHFYTSGRSLTYQFTFAATAPTGNPAYGLSSGQPTFFGNNRFEHRGVRFIPSLELGLGDSTTLANDLVTRNFSSLGPLAHFQTGVEMPVYRSISFEADAYEQLPIGDQKIYASRPGPDQQTVVTGRSVSEDNGFITLLSVPFESHVIVSGYYNRSLRLHDDVVSAGLTYVLRGFHARRMPSRRDRDDELMRSIERELGSQPAQQKP